MTGFFFLVMLRKKCKTFKGFLIKIENLKTRLNSDYRSASFNDFFIRKLSITFPFFANLQFVFLAFLALLYWDYWLLDKAQVHLRLA